MSLPSPPTNVIFTAVTYNSITLSWDPNQNATSYQILVSINGATYVAVNNGEGLAYTSNSIEGVGWPSYTPIYFQVYSQNNAGLSPAVSVSTTTYLPPPASITLVNLTNTFETISWPSVSQATYYNIYLGTSLAPGGSDFVGLLFNIRPRAINHLHGKCAFRSGCFKC